MLQKCIKRGYSTPISVGFIGLGNMGSPMAANLAKRKELNVIVHDNDVSKLNSFARSVAKPAALFPECNKIVTMLPNNDIVTSVYMEHLIPHAPKGATLIDCSTVSPGLARRLSSVCHQNQLNYLDAPVSGGVKGAQEATLAFLVGGDSALLEENRHLFMAMGKKAFHCGEAGSGQAAKLCNNLILGISMTALSEALLLGKKLGLDPNVLSEVINSSSGRSWCSEGYNPVPNVMPNVPASRDYQGGFATRLMLKDLTLALMEAKEAGVKLPLGDNTRQMYEMASKTMSDKDFSCIYKYIESLK